METKYSKEELQKMRIFEALMQIRELKAGDVVTERQMKAIEDLVGPDLLEKIRAMQPKTLAAINFTKSGEPYTTDGNPLGVTVDGKKPLDLMEERVDAESKN